MAGSPAYDQQAQATPLSWLLPVRNQGGHYVALGQLVTALVAGRVRRLVEVAEARADPGSVPPAVDELSQAFLSCPVAVRRRHFVCRKTAEPRSQPYVNAPRLRFRTGSSFPWPAPFARMVRMTTVPGSVPSSTGPVLVRCEGHTPPRAQRLRMARPAHLSRRCPFRTRRLGARRGHRWSQAPLPQALDRALLRPGWRRHPQPRWRRVSREPRINSSYSAPSCPRCPWRDARAGRRHS